MSDTDRSTDATERFESWKSQYRSELEAFEGEGPPSTDQLRNVARREAEAAAEWLDDMPATDDTVETAIGAILKAVVALEMAEERRQDGGRDE